MVLQVGILTVSDRVSRGEMADQGGPAVVDALQAAGAEVVATAVVPDDVDAIGRILLEWADVRRIDAIFTTGGTGLSPRDVTPEATMNVCDRSVPGLAEAMRTAGRRETAGAMLSRAVAGVRGTSLIINLPGSPRGAAQGVEVVLPILSHAVATLHGGNHEQNPRPPGE